MKYTIIPVTSYQQNCSLLVCEKTHKAAVIDPGGDVDLILAALDKEKAILEKIFLTHGHLDHVGATAELASMFSVPIEGPHHDDQFWLEALPSQCASFGFPDVDTFTPNCWLKDGDKVEFGDIKLNVIHCPGHTPGHIIFFQPEEKLAWVGDVLFNGSIGRTDFPKGDFQVLIHSIKEKLWPLGEDVAFIPGHGPMSTFGEEMRSNPFVS
jgi:glyoxylase-like metal-dependent hydrolase (beta-lactamase superfamily II)